MTSEKLKFPTYEDEREAFLTDLAEIEAVLTRKARDTTLSSDLTHEEKFIVVDAIANCLASRANASDLSEYFKEAEDAAENELFNAVMCLYAVEVITASFDEVDTLDQVVVDGLKSCQEWVSIAKDRLRLIKATHDSLTATEKHNS